MGHSEPKWDGPEVGRARNGQAWSGRPEMGGPEMAGPEMGYTRNSEQIYKYQLGILGSTFTHILEFHKCKKYETKIGFGTLLTYLNDLSGGMGKSAEFVAKYSKVHIDS